MSVTIDAAGVDTWSPAWYVDPESHTGSVLNELATEHAARGRLLPDSIAGHRVGWFPGSGLMYAEGHPAADTLASPDVLPAALDDLVAGLDDFGLPSPRGLTWGAWMPGGGSHQYAGFAGVRRLDATVNVRAESGATGRAILAGVAAIAKSAPRTHAELRFNGGRLETVYFRGHGGKKVLGRWYDKGVEASLARPGELLRAEDQRRWTKATRRDVEELTTSYVREKWAQRFRPLWQAAKGVTVGGHVAIAEALRELVLDGSLDPADAERLIGHVVCESVGIPAPSGRTRRRRRGELRELGLVPADGVLDELVDVDLGQVLEAALEADCWGAG